MFVILVQQNVFSFLSGNETKDGSIFPNSIKRLLMADATDHFAVGLPKLFVEIFCDRRVSQERLAHENMLKVTERETAFRVRRILANGPQAVNVKVVGKTGEGDGLGIG